MPESKSTTCLKFIRELSTKDWVMDTLGRLSAVYNNFWNQGEKRAVNRR